MKSILITGCNRGIGLGLIKYVSENYNNLNHIFATCRNIEKAKDLSTIAENHKNIHILQTDLKKENDILKVKEDVSLILNNQGLDVLVNNAGISLKFTRLQLVKYNDLMEHFQVNTIAPIMLTKVSQVMQALLPILKKGLNENGGHGVVVNMSSVLGSIEQNATGGYYPYRTSKAALNAATKSMSSDLKSDGITVVSLHPGWIKTDMGGINAPTPVETAVVDIMNFISKISPEQNGQFFEINRKIIPW